MKCTEELLWILDTPDGRFSDKKVQQNIDFVHSLGLKCDSVGWCKIDLGSPKAEEYLEKIATFCKSEDLWARGWYTRKYAETQSTWYKLGTASVPYDATGDFYEFPMPISQTGKLLSSVKAYMLSPHSPKGSPYTCIPASVKNALEEIGVTGLNFCWIRDVGRYESEQYYNLYTQVSLPRFYNDRGLKYEIRTDVATEYPKIWERILALGGMLPKVASLFYDLHISLPKCYDVADLPMGGIAEVYAPIRFTSSFDNVRLIHEDLAKKLLDAKVISPRDLVPVPVVDCCPAGYHEEPAYPIPLPAADFIAEREKERIRLEAKSRPRRVITEKQAVSALRKAIRERKEDFQKAMPKAAVEALADTPYAPLASYYTVANGGELSDEYELLPFTRALEETAIFQEELASEELLETPPQGIVVALCPDGDRILLLTEGGVIRFSHEAPEAIAQWPSLAQFIYDAWADE